MAAESTDQAPENEEADLSEVKKRSQILWALARHNMILDSGVGTFGPPVDNTELFLYDNWRNYKGLQYLAGILRLEGPEQGEIDSGDVAKVVTLMYELYTTGDGREHIAEALLNRYSQLCRIWDSGNHPEYNPPLFYIEWAISKGYVIPWLHNILDFEWILPAEKRCEYPLLAQVFPTPETREKRGESISKPVAEVIHETEPARTEALFSSARVNKLRRNSLDPAIDKAIKIAGNMKLADVYLRLRELAIEEEKPFNGMLEGGALFYTDDNGQLAKLTKDALGKRLKKRGE